MLRSVKNARRSDDDLKRYYAYRCAVWKSLNPKTDWKVLAEKLGMAPAALVAFTKGRNGSPAKVEVFARVLGPDSEDAFKQLARTWAEKYPTWNPERDPLPERIEFTGDALVDGAEASKPMYSDDLRAAVRALPGLMPCTVEEAKHAGEIVWVANSEILHDWLGWLSVLRGCVESVRKGGGRPGPNLKLV
jgi:hypothetical protein